MKKVFLLVAVFLVGITTQAETNTKAENVTFNPGSTYRYTNAQEITFVENGVLYAVTTDGAFSFQFLHPSQNNYRRGGTQQLYYNNNRRNRRIDRHNDRRARVARDCYGNIIAIGQTQITYKRNGKVRNIGRVPLRYHRGLLISVGNMEITYNRRGLIRDTFGFINRQNRNQWQNDGYAFNGRREGQIGNDWSDLERQHTRNRGGK